MRKILNTFISRRLKAEAKMVECEKPDGDLYYIIEVDYNTKDPQRCTTSHAYTDFNQALRQYFNACDIIR